MSILLFSCHKLTSLIKEFSYGFIGDLSVMTFFSGLYPWSLKMCQVYQLGRSILVAIIDNAIYYTSIMCGYTKVSILPENDRITSINLKLMVYIGNNRA